MSLIYAFEVFGREIPNPGLPVIAVAGFILFFLVSRGGPSGSPGGGRMGRQGTGRMHQCTRCGRNFQPQQVEVLADGRTNRVYDDRCPNCGWDLDWGNADKKGPGGASGGW